MKKNCVFYRTKIHRTVLKQPIRIEYLIEQRPLAEKQVPIELKPGTPEHRTAEHGIPAEHRRNTRTLTEQRNTGRAIGIARKNET